MKTNRLSQSKSLYLKQHATNPVDWFPWGEEALEKAQNEDKPILVSIGYAACHWCHVMEKECFEDMEVAELMNSHFVAIKIDREERPDLDNLYMDAIQAMGIQGGWPLNVFLMPDQQPFYGGTYFPKPQWMKVLSGIANAYSDQHEELAKSARGFGKSLRLSLVEKYGLKARKSSFQVQDIRLLGEKLIDGFDPVWGGMKRVPKFPMPSIWAFLLDLAILDRQHDLGEKVCFTLKKIGMGGIYDQVGGGFCRYSVDGEWFAPHFEKMLYDNGQLLALYAKAFQYTDDAFFKEKVEETIQWLLREMKSPENGFYAALDADSEGKEGKYYIWKAAELQQLLGDDYGWFAKLYAIKSEGNWESGENILFQKEHYEKIADSLKMSKSDFIEKLYKAKQIVSNQRNERVRPGLDDKVISGWNGWVIQGLCQAYHAFHQESYRDQALSTGNFLWTEMVKGNELFRNYKEGEVYTSGFLEDYAAVIQAFISLYTLSFDTKWLERADLLMTRVMDRFLDKSDSLFFFNDPKNEKLIADKKEIFDNVIPASNSIMARNLHRLGIYLYKDEYLDLAENMVQLVQELLLKEPSFLANWANLYLEKTLPTAEIAILGPDAESRGLDFQKHYYPNTVLAAGTGKELLPLLKDKPAGNNQYFVCFNKTCNQPVGSLEEAVLQLPHLS
ncbi:thioredoxin domain-containing protein [Cyclobacterium jeungdonense]|uniref:Thioredoxin domain-containing protein n=1 Tax=Cyclobacterium jeungdonense TaxID=708087 RepID=A0ABT8CBX4_9BACT|nr:thioredoxin domain-containing protein [Cyclobacterium jeungdonense]MDN3690011.1 thioredoxin domain-containing protein [Cyclobacterium jeungdonense]